MLPLPPPRHGRRSIPPPRTCQAPGLSQTPGFLRLPRSPRRRPHRAAGWLLAAVPQRRPPPLLGSRPAAPGVPPLPPLGARGHLIARAPPPLPRSLPARWKLNHGGGCGRAQRLPAPPSWLWAGAGGRLPLSAAPGVPASRGGAGVAHKHRCAPASMRPGVPGEQGAGQRLRGKAERKEKRAQGGSHERARAQAVEKRLCEARGHGRALRGHPGNVQVTFPSLPSAGDVFPEENSTFSSVWAWPPCSKGCLSSAEALVGRKPPSGDVPRAAAFAKVGSCRQSLLPPFPLRLIPLFRRCGGRLRLGAASGSERSHSRAVLRDGDCSFCPPRWLQSPSPAR